MAGHETHEHEQTSSPKPKSKSQFTAAFWFTIILIGLFIASLNFVNVMGSEKHEKSHHTEEASGSGTHEGEAGTGHSTEQATEHHEDVKAADTAHHENH